MHRAFACWLVGGALFACSENERAVSDPGGSSGSSTSGSSGTNATGGSAGTTGGSSAGGSAASGGTSGAGVGGTAGSAGSSGSGGSSGTGGMPGECGDIPTFEDGASPTREIFLDAAAPGPGDGSAGDPYNELETALSELTPGTALRIRPGTYAGGAFASSIAGTAAAPIWIGGIPGMARPILSGGSTPSS